MNWISMEERKPDVQATFLIAYKEKSDFEKEWRYGVDAASYEMSDEVWCTFHDIYEGQELHTTHWMPLPTNPEQRGEYLNYTTEQLEAMLFAITYSAVSHTPEMRHKGKKARARETLKVIEKAAQTMNYEAVRALIKKGEE